MGTKLDRSIEKTAEAVAEILRERSPSIYLYGSCVLNDFRPGWSDIDILVLTGEEIAEHEARRLMYLRQELLATEPDNPCYRSFEGGMLSLAGLISGEPDRVVYWGTSGERLDRQYRLDCFSRMLLLERGVLLHGEDIRSGLRAPDYGELCRGVEQQLEGIRRCAQKTDRSFYSYGWLLDIARCLYTLRTGRVAAKTAAGEWALAEGLCPVPDALERAVAVRREPLRLWSEEAVRTYAEGLGPEVQRFADALERELEVRRCH